MPAITGTTIMILTNVGLQLFNSMRGNRTNEAMRQKQQEFQRASQERNHERMMQLLREGQAMQEEWEKEMHDTRVSNINEDFDQLISRVFQQQALQHWPLSVLPMVMKNQSLGSYRAKSDENIALHVILTPSNSQSFNSSVFPQIEQGVEAFCNRHWNTHSNHPILFYGGAWKSRTAPSGNDISQLKADLPHLPVLLITPYFSDNDDKLVFNINMWGVGQEQDAVIIPTEKEFSYYNIYAKEMNYGEELASTTIEEFIPYLQCLIGYLADVYFWSAHAVAPILPSLLTMGAINTDGMKYLIEHNSRQYQQLLKKNINLVSDKNRLFQPSANIFDLYNGTKVLLSNDFQPFCNIKPHNIDVDFIIIETFKIEEILNRADYLQKFFLESDTFLFGLWNDFTIVGTFLDKNGIQTISSSLTPKFLIFYNDDHYDSNPHENMEYYIYNLQNKTLKKMENRNENPISQFRVKLGNLLIKHGESMLRERTSSMLQTNQSDVWGHTQQAQSPNYSVEQLCQFFVDAIDAKRVAAVAIDKDMSLSIVLEWLQSLDLTNIDANRLYLLKYYTEKYERYVYCAFLGNNSTFLINKLELTKCFVCKSESSEMKDIYGDKLLYVVPFEK